MQRYLDVSTQIYKTYLKYVSPADIYPYSIDEVFIDVTGLSLIHILRQECRIVLDGEERWVSNVVMRGEIEDAEYAMIFLRDLSLIHICIHHRRECFSDVLL